MKHIHCPKCNYPIYESDFENASEVGRLEEEIIKLLDSCNPAVQKIIDKILAASSDELKLTQEEIEILEAWNKRSEI